MEDRMGRQVHVGRDLRGPPAPAVVAVRLGDHRLDLKGGPRHDDPVVRRRAPDLAVAPLARVEVSRAVLAAPPHPVCAALADLRTPEKQVAPCHLLRSRAGAAEPPRPIASARRPTGGSGTADMAPEA